MANATSALAVYRPDARGQLPAREAIAQYHGAHADNVILTPGTSISYYYAFRLLANPGDEILCPTPTYPLFDDIAALAGVGVRRYHLHREDGTSHWGLDPEELLFQITPRTRAIVIVSPHNPTGSVTSTAELKAACAVARKHKLAIIFDEVFRENIYGSIIVPRPTEFDVPLCVTLNGFSKMLSLPGLKAGWMVVDGEQERCAKFLNACEYLSDTLLPVSEVTQTAIPALLKSVPDVAHTIASGYEQRMREFVTAWRSAGFDATMPEGSPYLCVSLHESWRGKDEQIVEQLAREGILLHTGTSYGFEEPWLVSTCVSPSPWPLSRVADVLSSATG
jgi:aspartate/methionine/tyrosine aminotransferase